MCCSVTFLTDQFMPTKGAPRRLHFSTHVSPMNLGKNREFELPRRYGWQLLLTLVAVTAYYISSASIAWADSVTLQSGVSPAGTYQTQDAHVRNDTGNLGKTDNNTRILFGALPTGALRGLFSYPLTGFEGGIPTGATINSVEFQIVQVDIDTNAANVAAEYAFELRTISESFAQGTGVLDPPNGSSWNNTFGATMTLGGTVLTSALMNTKPEVIPIQTDSSTWINTTFATSPTLVAAVQAQLNANQPFNFALVAPAAVETSGIRSFIRVPSNTELTTTAENRPRLIIDYTVGSAGMPGDYNGDNQVDAADYTVWRDNIDGDAASFAVGSRDPENSGVVNNADYEFWKSHFGGGSGGGSSLSGAAVPEPSTLALLVMAMAASLMKRRRT